MVPRKYVNRRSNVRDIDVDFNAPPASENLNMSSSLQIYLVVIETDVDGDNGYDNNGLSDHVVKDYSDPDLNEVPNDIDDEGVNDDRNVKC